MVEDSPRAVADRPTSCSRWSRTQGLQAVTEGPDGILAGLGPGKVYVDMTTGSPAGAAPSPSAWPRAGAAMLDAPVSGRCRRWRRARLSIMVGGDQAAYDRVEPILLDVGPTVRRIGENGQAVLLKIAINLSLHVQMVAFSEGVLLAEKGGIDKEVAVEAMLNSVIASPMIKYRGPFVLKQPEEAWFDVNMMQKDMNLALEAGRELDVPMPTTAISNELLTAARGMGLAHHDFAIVYEVLAQMAGLKRVER